MKNVIKLFSALSIIFVGQLSAQQQIIKKDTLSGTELVIAMDSRVNDALNALDDKCSRTIASRGNSGNDDDRPTSTRPTRVMVPNRELTKAEICRKNPRMMGYKIQLTTVKSNEEANEVRSYFRNRFPNLKVEVDASLRPNYKVLAGSYFSKQTAAADLSRIREYFKSATAVQYRIFCVEAK